MLYLHLVSRGFKSQHSVWYLGTVMQCCLLIWFCSVVLSWATGWRLFGWAMRSSVWVNELRGGQGWKIESHTHTHAYMHPHTTPGYRCLILQHRNSAVLTQSTPPHPLSFISLSSPSTLRLVALLLAVCKFIHCENGRQLRTAQFHLVFYSVIHRLPACCSHSHFIWN